MRLPADWQRAPGVSRGLWQALHDPDLARGYDAQLADSPLPAIDLPFALRHFPRPGRLLDLGCGTGRLLIPLAERGYWTLGIDLSEEMLRVAAEKAARARVAVHLLKANLVDLGCLDDQSFDYAACLFSTLGMVAGKSARRGVLGQVFRLLKPGGVFVVHVHNRWFNLWNRQARWWLLKDWLQSWLRWRPGGDHVAPALQGLPGLELHLFTRREIVILLKRAGFRIVELWPLSLRCDGRLPRPWWFSGLRAHGYLIAAQRPANETVATARVPK